MCNKTLQFDKKANGLHHISKLNIYIQQQPKYELKLLLRVYEGVYMKIFFF